MAIISLDPSVPEFVEHHLEIPAGKVCLNFMYLISRLGLSRLMPVSAIAENFPLLKSGGLNERDREEYKTMFYKSTYTGNVLREIDYLRDKAKKAGAGGVPSQTPHVLLYLKRYRNCRGGTGEARWQIM